MGQATAITKTTRDRLNMWLTREYIRPSINRADGRGTKNIFSFEDLCLIELFRQLLDDFGFYRARADQYLKAVKAEHIESLGRAYKELILPDTFHLIFMEDLPKKSPERLFVDGLFDDLLKKGALVSLYLAFVERQDSQKQGIEVTELACS